MDGDGDLDMAVGLAHRPQMVTLLDEGGHFGPPQVLPVGIGPGSVQLADVNGDGAGDDQLLGEGGHDRIAGDDGRDAVLGGSGNDRLAGGPGVDRLLGDAGTDSCAGGGQAGDVILTCE